MGERRMKLLRNLAERGFDVAQVDDTWTEERLAGWLDDLDFIAERNRRFAILAFHSGRSVAAMREAYGHKEPDELAELVTFAEDIGARWSKAAIDHAAHGTAKSQQRFPAGAKQRVH